MCSPAPFYSVAHTEKYSVQPSPCALQTPFLVIAYLHIYVTMRLENLQQGQKQVKTSTLPSVTQEAAQYQ